MLRLGSYNVHNFSNSKDIVTTTEIAKIISKFDVVGIQEANYRISQLKEYNPALNFAYTDPQIQNGAIFNEKINQKDILRSVYYKFDLIAYPRGVLSVIFRYNDTLIHLYVTHLDHKDEDIRLKQTRKLYDIINEERRTLYNGKNFMHFITGDFNALCREDYSYEEWQDIANIRKQNNWESPKTDVMNMFTKQLGYYDLLGDFCRSKNVKVPMTSRFDTRVDYILCSHPLTVVNAGYIDSDASDHLPIYVDVLLN